MSLVVDPGWHAHQNLHLFNLVKETLHQLQQDIDAFSSQDTSTYNSRLGRSDNQTLSGRQRLTT